jgi:pimeloyl-ACP methyl ester carboxylesterase
MTPLQGLHHNTVPLQVDGVTVDVATIGRSGPLEPIVFLHGFGSTKEDYAHIVRHPAFDGRPFLSWDAPGCGGSDCGDLSKVSIPFLVATAEAMDSMTIPSDIFGNAQATFGPNKRLGSNASRLSQIVDGKWKVIADYPKN